MQNSKSQDVILGLALLIGFGLLSWWLASFAPRIGSVTIAIVLGVLVGNLLGNQAAVRVGGDIGDKTLLPIAIALLGVELQLTTLVSLGPVAAVIIVVSIAVALVASVQLGRRIGFSRRFSVLLGAGNGICGSSAVAATSLVIQADEDETGISIAVVNLLGTIGIVLLPVLIQAFSLADAEGGLLIGGTLQAFGQVVAAGYLVNDDVGNIATVVKMGRVLLLGPMVVLIGMWMARSGGQQGRAKVRIPRFIFGFLAMSILASSGLLSPEMLSLIKTAGKLLLVFAMVGIGLRIQLRTLFRSGASALMLGGMVSVIQIIVTLVLIIVLV